MAAPPPPAPAPQPQPQPQLLRAAPTLGEFCASYNSPDFCPAYQGDNVHVSLFTMSSFELIVTICRYVVDVHSGFKHYESSLLWYYDGQYTAVECNYE